MGPKAIGSRLYSCKTIKKRKREIYAGSFLFSYARMNRFLFRFLLFYWLKNIRSPSSSCRHHQFLSFLLYMPTWRRRSLSQWRGNRNVGNRPLADKMKRRIRWCGQALLGSFHFIISQVLPTVTNDFLFHFLFKRRAIEPQLVIWRWIALRKGNESLAGTKKKEKMNKDRSSVPTFIKEKIMWARSIIHFSSSFMCRLARLMIGTVKKGLSLDPANKKKEKLDRQSYSAYHHLLTLITCSNTLFSF